MLSTRKGRTGAAVLAATVAAGGIALGVGPASAGTSSLFTITGVTAHLVPASTANQVITVTGTGFSEDDLASVNISGCATSASVATPADLVYVVTSPTTLVVKTNAFCTGTNNVVTLTDATTAGDTVVSVPGSTSGAMKLDFVTPPNLAASNPVVQLNSAGQGAGAVKTAAITGGQTIKVTAGSVPFQSSTAFPLAASLGGVALTGITPHFASGTSGPVDSFTGKVGAHAAGAVALAVTSAGITKNFPASATGFSYAGTTISVAPAFGPSDGGNVLKITGAGFVPAVATGSSVVTICGVPSTIVQTGSTATLLNVTVPPIAVTTPGTDPVDGACTVKVVTAGLASVVSSGSTYTYLGQG